MPIAIVIFLAFFCGTPRAATPNGTTGYDTAPVSVQQAPVQPHLPYFLPNGAVNLDEAWIEYGGARPYWNSVTIPRQLRLGGASWVDPALVPELLAAPKQATPVRKWTRRSTRKIRKAMPRISVKVPPNAGSTALKKPVAKVPPVPLPVKPVKPAKPPVLAEPLVTDDYTGPVTPLQ